MSHQQQTLLESFRNSTIEKSIKLASERLSHQRKLFVNNNNNNSTASKKEEVYNKHFLEPHLQTQSNFIHNDFGLIASVATPAQLIDDPTQDQQILVQSNRVTCFAKNNTNNNNSNLLFSGFDDGSISIWSVPDGKWIAHGVPPQNDNNNSFSGFSTRGISVSSSTSRTKLIASTHRNGSLALWKYDLDEEHETKERKQFHPYHVIHDAKSSRLRQCEFSPIDENILAVSNDNGTVQIYSTTSSSSSSPLLLLSLENGIPPSLLQQTSLGSSSSSSLTQHQQNQQFKTPETRCLSFHPDGALLAVGDSSGSFSLWDLRDGSRIYNSSSHKPLHSGRINDIVFSKNSGGYNFFSAGDDGLVYCFDLRKLSPNTTVSSTPSNFVWRQAAHGDAVSALCLHPKNDDILFSEEHLMFSKMHVQKRNNTRCLRTNAVCITRTTRRKHTIFDLFSNCFCFLMLVCQVLEADFPYMIVL